MKGKLTSLSFTIMIIESSQGLELAVDYSRFGKFTFSLPEWP